MGRDRSRVVVLAFAYLLAIVPALFVLDWFVVDLGIDSLHIDLRRGHGLYSSAAMTAFWGSIVIMIPGVAFQTFTRVATGTANARLSRYGMIIGLALLTAGLAAGYLFAPELPPNLTLVRTPAALVFMAANVLGIATLYYAALDTTDDDAGVYKPIVLEKPIEKRSPTVPPRTPTAPPRSPTLPPETKRSPTLPPETKRSPTLPPGKHKLSYVVLSGELTRAGIDARREDGTAFLVMWRDVVGVVVRRVPDELDATTFMDIVSVKGSTLRIVPWTRLSGISVVGLGDDRMRSLATYIATMCSDVQLFDPATRTFLEKNEPAAQLKDVAKLAAHDERLA